MADDEQQDIPPNVEAAFNEEPPVPSGTGTALPADAKVRELFIPASAADNLTQRQGGETTFPTTDSIPEDQPKFFTPPEAQEAAPEPAVDFQMDQLPPEALATMERLQAEARPQQSQQQRRVQAASQQKAQQRRQRLGKPDTPQEQQSAQDVWASLQEDPFNEQAFNDSPAGQEFAAPQGPGNVAGGGGQGGGMEKLVQVGDKILAKLDKIEGKFKDMTTAIDAMASSLNEISSNYG